MKVWTEITPKQQVERWENVLRVLQALSPHERRKHWDMQNWGLKNDCGTVACAAGHCGMDPWFRRRGWILEPTVISPEGLDSPDDGGLGEFRHGEAPDFFGWEGTEEIFFNSTRRPVSQVIREVRKYIKELKATP